MNAININIEGYNMNGICVGCLNHNRKMFFSEEVKNCYKLLGNIDVPEGLTLQVCWECLAAVRVMSRFRTQMLRSYQVLIDYSREHTFLYSPADLARHATQRLQVSRLPPAELPAPDEVKVEVADVDDQVKEEEDKFEDFYKDEPDHFSDSNDALTILEEPAHTEPVAIIEDDIPRVKKENKVKKKLKKDDKKKVKRKSSKDKDKSERKSSKDKERKSSKDKERRKSKEKRKGAKEKKKTGKFKKFSEELVETYTMTEAEMWAQRSEDASHEDFLRLRHRCGSCLVGFHNARFMQAHVENKHGEDPTSTQCDVCRCTVNPRELPAHREQHLTALRCRRCPFRTALARLMSGHVRQHDTPVVLKTYKCNVCGDEFSSKTDVLQHKNLSLSCKDENPKCDCCGKLFANKLRLRVHLEYMAGKKSSNKPEKLQIPCEECGKIFFSKKTYKNHVVIHDGVTHPCPVCGKLFQWKGNLARHLRLHADKKVGARYECRQCGKRFSSREGYNKHMRYTKTHGAGVLEVNRFACDHCGKKFQSKIILVDHIDWDHLKKVKYVCAICHKPFKSQLTLSAHVNNIHEGKKKVEPEGEHLCDMCGKYYKVRDRQA
ncbi:hypothetical protein JYU34_010834 [Plutella xylostella]|uniref:C2H2-type domain-containing protein n=1 Tax=Plutella xylostella TaxID=51655 RepID=A0ABQ7QFQ9_PLUXY|nr:hypothetical protein JYU34_010834 [Plutella xylostella]